MFKSIMIIIIVIISIGVIIWRFVHSNTNIIVIY